MRSLSPDSHNIYTIYIQDLDITFDTVLLSIYTGVCWPARTGKTPVDPKEDNS